MKHDPSFKTITIADNAQAPRCAAGDAVKVRFQPVEPGDLIYRDGIVKTAREPGDAYKVIETKHLQFTRDAAANF